MMNNDDYYMEFGYCVFTEKYLKNRGYCCNNGCRHCPYKKNNMVVYENISMSELTSIKQELNDLIEKTRFDIEKRIKYEDKLKNIQKLITKKIDNLEFD